MARGRGAVGCGSPSSQPHLLKANEDAMRGKGNKSHDTQGAGAATSFEYSRDEGTTRRYLWAGEGTRSLPQRESSTPSRPLGRPIHTENSFKDDDCITVKHARHPCLMRDREPLISPLVDEDPFTLFLTCGVEHL